MKARMYPPGTKSRKAFTITLMRATSSAERAQCYLSTWDGRNNWRGWDAVEDLCDQYAEALYILTNASPEVAGTDAIEDCWKDRNTLLGLLQCYRDQTVENPRKAKQLLEEVPGSMAFLVDMFPMR